jgi:hypothetical protein
MLVDIKAELEHLPYRPLQCLAQGKGVSKETKTLEATSLVKSSVDSLEQCDPGVMVF